MKGMIFFIIGIIIVFGVFSLSQRSIQSNETVEAAEKQEIKQELEKKGVEIDADELEKAE